MNDAAAVSTNSVTFGYRRTLVLNGVSVSVVGGEMVGILGPNGSGKSTLLKTMLGYLHPRDGAVLVHDEPIVGISRIDRARMVALVPQHSASRMPLTVEQTVLLGRYARIERRFGGFTTEDRAAVSAVLSELGIAPMAERPVTELSGGEFQKVLLARALVQQTPIVLLDEATNNLDIHHTLQIMSLIRERARRHGLAVVAVLHDINLAAAWCDRLVFLKEGRVVRCGPPEEVITSELLRAVYGVELPVRLDEAGRPFVLLRGAVEAPSIPVGACADV